MTDLDLFGDTITGPSARRAGMGSHQATSSITDEWITPREIIAALGTFDLDPCSPGDRRPWDTARNHLSIEDDGLTAPWAGRVWLNPPRAPAPSTGTGDVSVWSSQRRSALAIAVAALVLVLVVVLGSVVL